MKDDTPGAHTNKRLPILDMEVQVCDGKIIHYHYSKPMSSLEVILSRSSISMGSKLDILTQEANRRLRNCFLSLPWTDKLVFLNKLMIQMMWAKYPVSSREIVARRSLAKLDMDLHNHSHLGRPIYRSKQERNQVTKKNKANWFRGSGATTTFTVPST